VIVKNCFVVAASYPFLPIFVGIGGSVTHFSELGVTLPMSRTS